MSSHHFVKEGQEPALFILETISFHRIEPLLEWVPLIMVSDDVLEAILPWGIKIDVVLQHQYPMDKIEAWVSDQYPLQILPCETGTVITTGLEFLSRNSFTAVNIIGGLTPETARAAEDFGHSVQVGMYNDIEKWSFVSQRKFEKWMPAGAKISVRFTPGSAVQTENIIKTEENWEIADAGLVKVQSSAPFWFGEPF